MMEIALVVVLLVGIVGAAVTALWNALEAHRLRALREWEESALEDLQTVVNGNADVMLNALNYMQGLSDKVTKLVAKGELYDLAFSIRPQYPSPEEKFEADILKLD